MRLKAGVSDKRVDGVVAVISWDKREQGSRVLKEELTCTRASGGVLSSTS